MAVHEKRGWIWTEEEKQWAQSWQAEISRRARQITEQAKRFSISVPQFADEASLLSQQLASVVPRLLAIDAHHRGRKYQHMSPEEARAKLKDAEGYLASWMSFISRPDVTEAIRAANRVIRRARRDHCSAVGSAQRALIAGTQDAQLRAKAGSLHFMP